jgi:hypothetical protein
VHQDVEAARRLRPEAVMLGVKYSCVLYPEIEHVWTQHLEQARHIREKAGRRVFVHSRQRVHQTRRSITWQAGNEHDIDYIWPELRWVHGSSGFAAGLWAHHGMGFSEVILCGVPLDPGGYAPEVAAWKKQQGDNGQSFVDTCNLMRWREGIMKYVEDGRASMIRSMSGWTRQVCGAPT